MDHFARMRALGLTCTLAFVTVVAAEVGPPPRIDSVQKAAQAISFADQILYAPHGSGWMFIEGGFLMAEGARRALLPAITPHALASMPGGITLACAHGGTLWAHSTRSSPWEIDIEFHDCVPYRSGAFTGNGPLHLSLRSESFAIDEIAGMRLGNTEHDLVVDVLYPGSTVLWKWTHNGVVQGRIEWPYDIQADLVTHRSAYEINGTMSWLTRSERPGEQQPTVDVAYYTADHLKVATVEAFGNDFQYEERKTTYVSGVITSEFGPPAARFTYTQEFADLSFSNVVDYLASTDLAAINGGLRYAAVNGDRRSCHNGDYLFRTKSPLRRLENFAFDSGELVINRSVNLHLYSAANVPAGLPAPVNAMLIHVELANGGSFDLDATGLGDTAQIGSCDF